SATGGSGAGKEPFRVEHDIELGGEAFQMRALAIASGLNPMPENVLRLAAAGRCNVDDSDNCASGASVATDLSRFSAAQAEYFYDHNGSEPREEWMWNMKWRARLVRLRPFDSESNRSSSPAPDPTSLCNALSSGSDCDAPTSALSSLANLTVH
ncbi:MAG TPA: hypothetical protein VL137_17700, partial [Polyangiaceae bacterium]|nr:hypothetical protein [Polyangiaceae bacterium]